jgi:VWFA-related protein
MESRFTLERAAAEAFVANLTPGDRARVGSFNGMIRIDPDGFTSDRDALIRILYLDLPDAGLTPLWNATASAMNALAPESGRRVVLLITDGDNNPGLPGRKTVSFLDVRDRAEKNDVMIYAVGVSGGCGQPSADPASSWTPSDGTGAVRAQRGMPPPPGGGPDNGGKPPSTTPRPFGGPMGPAGAGGRPVGTAAQPGPGVPIEGFFGNGMGESRCGSRTPNPELRSLAADGGGGYLELHDGDDLGTTFARLADELHHQYLLGFTITKLDGRVHALEVRARDPKMRVRSRNSYVAVAK